MQLRLTTDVHDGHAVIHLAGELDIASRPSLDEALLGALANAPHTLILELSGLLFIDSTGLGSIVAGQRVASARGVRLALVAPGPAVLQVLELLGLEEALPRYDSVADALREG